MDWNLDASLFKNKLLKIGEENNLPPLVANTKDSHPLEYE